MILENAFTVAVPMDRLFDALVDGEAVAACIPDASLTAVEAGAARGRLRLHVAGSTITYRGELRTLEADREAGALSLAVEGREIRGDGALRGTVAVRLRESHGSTTASLHGDLEATGRAATAGDHRLGAAVQRLLDELAAQLTLRLAGTEAAVAAPTEPAPTAETAAPPAPPPPAGMTAEASPPPPPAPAPAVAGTVRVMTTEPLDAATVPTSDDWLPRLRDLVEDRPWLVPLVLLAAVLLVLGLRRRDPAADAPGAGRRA